VSHSSVYAPYAPLTCPPFPHAAPSMLQNLLYSHLCYSGELSRTPRGLCICWTETGVIHMSSHTQSETHMTGQTLYVTTRITMYVHLLPCAVYTALISTESLRSVTQQTPKERERRNQVSPKGSKYPSSADLKCPWNATRLLLNGEKKKKKKKKRTRPTQPAPCFV
jgi:hypothetical protein